MSQRGLFRKEVIEALQEINYGQVIKIKPLSFMFYTVAAVAFTILTILYLANSEYGRKYNARGFLFPKGGVVNIHPEREGRVLELHAEQGQIVAQGDSLVTISTGENLAGGDNAQLELISELKQQQKLLERQLEQTTAEFKAELSELKLEKRLLRSEINHLVEKQKIKQELMLVSKSNLALKKKQSESGLIAKDRYVQEMKVLLNEREGKQSVDQSLEERKDLLEMVSLKLENLPIRQRQEALELERKISEKRFEIIKVSFARSATIRAPVSGRGEQP